MLPQKSIDAIVGLDELWNGGGHPLGQKGEEIPLLARILNLCQTFETFAKKTNISGAYDIARQRSGTWFDPELVHVLDLFRDDETFWQMFLAKDVKSKLLSSFEPATHGGQSVGADAATLDRIAHGFAQVIDAKSPWTRRHSEGVSESRDGHG